MVGKVHHKKSDLVEVLVLLIADGLNSYVTTVKFIVLTYKMGATVRC